MEEQNSKSDPKQTLLTVSTTVCRQCVFAQYDGNKQVGCAAGRLDVFRQNGVEVLDGEDEERKFFLIKDKACPYFRHKDVCGEFLKTHSLEDLHKKVAANLKMPYHALVFLRKHNSLEDLEKRLSELQKQSVPPQIVTVIDRSHSEDDLTPKIVGLFHNHYSFNTWRSQRVRSVDVSDISVVDICYDNTKAMKYFFYTIFEASKPIPATFSEEIHHSVQEKMKSFVLLEANSDGVGETVLKIAHKKYAGNSFEIRLKDKLIHYGDGVNLIRKVEDLCPSLRKS